MKALFIYSITSYSMDILEQGVGDIDKIQELAMTYGFSFHYKWAAHPEKIIGPEESHKTFCTEFPRGNRFALSRIEQTPDHMIPEGTGKMILKHIGDANEVLRLSLHEKPNLVETWQKRTNQIKTLIQTHVLPLESTGEYGEQPI